MRMQTRILAAAAALVLLIPAVPAATEASASAALSTEAPAASENPISGPVLGYLFDQVAHKLRPINGIPGASFIGTPAILNVELLQAEISPANDYALGVDAAGTVYRVELRNGVGAAQAVTGAISGVDRIFLSPLGDSAVVYDRQSRMVQTITGLHAQPRVGGAIELGDLPGVITALAVADDGRTVLVGAATREGGAIYSAVSGASAERIAPAGQVVSLAFLPGSNDALAADRQRQEALRITGIGRSPAVTVIASGADGLRSPTAVAASSDGSAAIVASVENRMVARVPMAGGALQMIDCSCEPRRLTAMGSLFRLTDNPAEPVYLLDLENKAADGRTVDPRVVFVPAAADAEPVQADFTQTRRAVRGR